MNGFCVVSVTQSVFFMLLTDRKIVAEYEKTVAQMIGELVPPGGSMLYICLSFFRPLLDLEFVLLQF